MKKTFFLLFFLIILLAIVSGIQKGFWNKQNVPTQSVSIEQYVKENIGKLSEVKEVLGGTFYVTKVEAQGGVGTVYYEDGHIAFVADFTYIIDPTGSPNITSFIIRK